MDLKFSQVRRKGPITTVTLSRPEVYNALHIEAHFELDKVFDDFAADPSSGSPSSPAPAIRRSRAGNDLKMAGGGRQARLGQGSASPA